MYVIFLDIDGVLNSRSFLAEGVPRRWPDEHLDPAKIHLLNQIIAQTGAVCVLSSIWRLHAPLPLLQRLLETFGFQGKILDYTSTEKRGPRGYEIRDWLAQHPEVERFVALDDDAWDMKAVEAGFVHTTWETGLQPEHAKAAIRILGNLNANQRVELNTIARPLDLAAHETAKQIGNEIRQSIRDARVSLELLYE